MGAELQATQDSEPAAPEAGTAAARLFGRDAVLERLVAAHGAWFDVERGYRLGGRTFPAFAAYHSSGEAYVLSKRAKLWEVANHEYVFFESVARYDEESLARDVSFMEGPALAVVSPGPNHMSSNISLVVICDEAAPGLEKAVRRVRFRKTYRLGIWGWTDLKLAVVDLSGSSKQGFRRPGHPGRVTVNGAGKALLATVESNLARPWPG